MIWRHWTSLTRNGSMTRCCSSWVSCSPLVLQVLQDLLRPLMAPYGLTGLYCSDGRGSGGLLETGGGVLTLFYRRRERDPQ